MNIAGGNIYSEELKLRRNVCRIITSDYYINRKVEDKMIKGISLILAFYENAFGFTFPADFFIKVRVFGEYSSYEKFLHEECGIDRVFGRGMYFFNRREIIMWGPPSEEVLLSLLYHEANHFIMHSQIDRCPYWLNEGLSEYFERLEIGWKSANVNLSREYERKCIYLKGSDYSFMKLKKYFRLSVKGSFRLDFGENDDEGAELTVRTIGWSIVYFLMSDEINKFFLKDILSYIKKNQHENNISMRAFDRVYPGGLEKFENDWHDWLDKIKSSHRCGIKF